MYRPPLLRVISQSAPHVGTLALPLPVVDSVLTPPFTPQNQEFSKFPLRCADADVAANATRAALSSVAFRRRIGCPQMSPSFVPTDLNAAIASSRSARECAALTWQRTRASPCGTTGNPNPVTKTPSSSNMPLILIADAVSPTIMGIIGVSPGSGLKPASAIAP